MTLQQTLFSIPAALIYKLLSCITARSRRILLCCLMPACLAACVGEKQNVVLDTFLKGIENTNSIIDRAPINPNYRYLKVEANGQPALLVLGYQDRSLNGITDIWYSSFKEVIQINGGRLIGTQGLDINWTEVALQDPPSLSDEKLFNFSNTSKQNSSLRFQRTRTVMPSYRANITETVEIQALPDAPDDAPKILRDTNQFPNLRWVQEIVVMQTNVSTLYLAPLRAIYAVDSSTSQVVYGKQCLTSQYCLSWLAWPMKQAEIKTK